MHGETKKIPPRDDPGRDFYIKSGDDLLSHTFARVVPSALEGLTAEFGMGSGVTPPLWSPEVFKELTNGRVLVGTGVLVVLLGHPMCIGFNKELG